MTELKSRRIAVIDLGSNTCRMVVFEAIDGYAYRLVDQIRELVRLREGMGPAGMSEPAMARAIATLRLCKRYCDSSSVDAIKATATSAVRDASNREEFLERATVEAGVNLRVLSGREEAYYGVVGALNNVQVNYGFVVDVGGGSAQVSRIDNGEFVDGCALPLGALRLTEAFVSTDPIAKNERSDLEDEIRNQLAAVGWLKQKSRRPLVGVGGTIRNLAYMDIARRGFPAMSLKGYVLTRQSVRQSVKVLTRQPQSKRERITGLNSDRADIIPAGAMVVHELMRLLRTDALTVSANGIREGLFLEDFWSQLESPMIPDVRRFGVLNVARMYKYEKAHANHVRYLALRLFDQLEPLHGYDADVRELLEAASMLHDIGTVIGYKGHHRHSETLILANGIAGFTTRETTLIAEIAKYHRKGKPDAGPYAPILRKGDTEVLEYLSAILRLAEFLERGRNSIVSDVVVYWDHATLTVDLVADEYPAVELWEARRKASPLLADVFGRAIVLKSLVPDESTGWSGADD